MKITTNMHIIEVKYFGATDASSSRVKLKSKRFGDAITETFNHMYNDIIEQAEQYLTKNGFEPVFHGEIKDGYIIGCNTFKPLKSKNIRFQAVSSTGKDCYEFVSESFEAARHWVINHLDSSKEWSIKKITV